jgi:hypothetical protein
MSSWSSSPITAPRSPRQVRCCPRSPRRRPASDGDDGLATCLAVQRVTVRWRRRPGVGGMLIGSRAARWCRAGSSTGSADPPLLIASAAYGRRGRAGRAIEARASF